MKENDIPSYTESCIIQYWLQGKIRDEIAQAFETSQGTVSNIIAKFRNKLGLHDADALREFGRELRRQNMTADNCAIGLRVHNIMEKRSQKQKSLKNFSLLYMHSLKKRVYLQKFLEML